MVATATTTEEEEDAVVSSSIEDVTADLAGILAPKDISLIQTPDDPRVAAYRMKKVRNHFVYSQTKKAMLDKNENWIVALTFNVVRRALRGRYTIPSILLTPGYATPLLCVEAQWVVSSLSSEKTCRLLPS